MTLGNSLAPYLKRLESMKKKQEHFTLAICSLLIAFLFSCGAEPAKKKSLYDDDEETIPKFNLTTVLDQYPRSENLGTDRKWQSVINLREGLELLSTESRRPIIAVFDSGIDYQHPAFQNNLWEDGLEFNGKCKSSKYGCDTTKYSGFDEDPIGKDSIHPASISGPGVSCDNNESGLNLPWCGHGTHVSGVIAGLDKERTFGVCPSCQILTVKVVNDNGDIQDNSIIAGLRYISHLKGQGVPIKIINASFGKFILSEKVALAIKELPFLGDDILLVTAAGNENTAIPSYPAGFDNTIAVANINSSNLRKDPHSNFGRWVDISAPAGSCTGTNEGFGIISATPANRATCSNGTSVAAPVVAGVAGLILASNPDMSAKNLKKRILESADGEALYRANPEYIVDVGGERVPLLGSGVVNVVSALKDHKTGYTRKNSERVQKNCGMISAGRPQSTIPLTMILHLPFFIGMATVIIRKIHA